MQLKQTHRSLGCTSVTTLPTVLSIVFRIDGFSPIITAAGRGDPGDMEIELLSDGGGLFVYGPSSDVDEFLHSEGLASSPVSTSSLGKVFRGGAAAATTGAELAANSGRWVKLTAESAAVVKKFGLMETKTPGVSHAMIGRPGDVKQWIQIVKTPGSMLTNPATLAGAAGILSQLAMQQQMSEITEFLQRIDQKIDSVLRMQTNQVLARVDGVELAVREAMSVRDAVGRVSDITWSKVQASTATLMETQALALRELSELARKVEQASAFGDRADVTEVAQAEARKWLVVLARCCHLQDAVGVLELERVLDASPDDLDQHRLGLKASREDRFSLIAGATGPLLDQMSVVAAQANAKVLVHPRRAPRMVESSNVVTAEVAELRSLFAADAAVEAAESRSWSDAAGEAWSKTRTTTADGLGALKQVGVGAVGHVGSAKDKLADKLGAIRNRGSDGDRPAE